MVRAWMLILLAALSALWGYYAAAVEPLDSARPVAVPADGADLSAASLNNEAVRLARAGRNGDALAYLQRARDFRPLDPVIGRNAARQAARVRKDGWRHALVAATGAAVVVLLVVGVRRGIRGARDRARLSGLKLAGDPWFVIPREGEAAELALRFTEPLDGLVARHPLTIVWSSAAHGKHMKSRPPATARGRALTVRLEGERLARLRRYPGEWKGFLYFGRTPIGEAAARVV
jgi:hypothetical protein